MDRRIFLRNTSLFGILLATTGSYAFLKDTDFKKGKEIEGYIKADLHVHLNMRENPRLLLDTLSQGLVGLALKHSEKDYLAYEQVLKLPGVKEIDKGMLAQVNFNGRTGYVIKTQEALSHDHLILVGIESYIKDNGDFEHTINEADKQGAAKILAHPYLVQKPRDFYIVSKKSITIGKVETQKEEQRIKEHMKMVDEFEAFNGMANDLFFGKLAFKEANERAEKLLVEFSHMKGLYVSDTHGLPRDVLSSNIYLPSDNLSRDSIVENIKNHNFIHGQKQYISRSDMLESMFF